MNMKSIKRKFLKTSQKNPYWSSYSSFANSITGQKISKKILSYWFSRLVEKDDYPKEDKKVILEHLYKISNNC